MTTKDQALKLALEALENTTPTGFNMESDKKFFAAITALREALANEALDRMAENARALKLADQLEDDLHADDGTTLGLYSQGIADNAAAELRRLHESNQQLVKVLQPFVLANSSDEHINLMVRTDDITKARFALREALAEQPAQPLPGRNHWEDGDVFERIGAMKKQPAQQQEPVAYMGTDIEGNPNKFRLNPFGGCVPLYEKPQSVKVWDAEGYDALCQELEGWKAKAQRKPLTDDEIAKEVEAELTHYWNGEYIDTTGARDQLTAFARAIESAHGIKENT